MRVLLLTRYSRMGASSRLRSLQYVESLAGHGVDVTVCSLLGDAYLRTIYDRRSVSPLMILRAYLARLRELLRSRSFDVLWIEKELFPNCPALFEWLLAKAGVPYIVDYDDAIFHNYDLASNPVKRLLKNKIAGVMRHAALVVAGNNYLLQHAREAGASRLALLPTVIDIRRYTPAAQAGFNMPLVVGWIGSPSTAKYLRPLLPVLARLNREYPLELAVVGADIRIPECGFIRNIPWQESTEVAEISRFDVGIMPLANGPFEKGKCGYKLIQYMACAKPVVASPVGVNADMVQNGVNGFLATDDKEWFAALSRLLASQNLRLQAGQHGRALVEEKYCLQVTAPKVLELLHSVATKGEDKRCSA